MSLLPTQRREIDYLGRQHLLRILGRSWSNIQLYTIPNAEYYHLFVTVKYRNTKVLSTLLPVIDQ